MVVTGRSSQPPPPLPTKPNEMRATDGSDGDYTAFSVSAAKAFFEAAKKPEVRQAAVAAAKNPFVRNVAKSAASDPATRNQLIAALEKQYGAKSPDNSRPLPSSSSSRPKYDDVAPPPPPPPHRAPSSVTSPPLTSSSYSSSSGYSSSTASDYSKPLPAVPSTSSYHTPTNGIAYPSLVNELQELQLNTQPVSPSQPHAIVKFSFNGSNVDELSSAAGDTVILKREVDEQWIYGMNNRTGANGIIPLSFLDIRVPLTASFPTSGVIATAIYDFDSSTPGDLTFRANDQIRATERVGPDWLRGSIGSREGIFPANFVSCPGIDSLPLTQPAAQAAPIEKMTAAFDYSSGVAGDLEFKAGDTIEVIARLDQEWIRGRVNQMEGLAPLSFLAPYGTPVKSPKKRGLAAISALGGSGRMVTAIADHCTDDPTMLYFSKGDRIIIVEDVDHYWYRGKVEGFKTLPAGLFPKAIVKED